MKTQEEIEMLCEDFLTFRKPTSNVYHVNIREAVVFGYTQCQKDCEKEINRLKKIMIESSHRAMSLSEEKARNKDRKFTEQDLMLAISLAQKSFIGFGSSDSAKVRFVHTANEILQQINE